MQKVTSELKFPNIWLLRELCLEQLAEHPTEEMTTDEWTWVKSRIQSQMRTEMAHDASKQNPEEFETSFSWSCKMCADLSPDVGTQLPKWAVFASWLSPEGLVSEVPILITDVVRSNLGI